ncbi:MAG: hypothetical protein SGBAC_001482 [Bacillariaceae sp.]
MESVPPIVNAPKKIPDDDDKSLSSNGTIEQPTETEQRYAALRNHQIRFVDAIDLNAERVHKLRKKDIVFGRGRGFQNHPGNERMRVIIEKHKTHYHSLNRDGKRKLVEKVHAEITESGARFLKKLDDVNAWVIVELPIALQKVSHTMRCRKSIIRKLDEDGNLPRMLGGQAGFGVHPGRSAALAGMPRAVPGAVPGVVPGAVPRAVPGAVPRAVPRAIPAIPGMVSAATIPGMSPSAGLLPGANPAVWAGGLGSHGPSGMYAPETVGASDTSLAALEAKRRAAIHRYRVLAGIAAARPGEIEYYKNQRREQLLRETRMLQQMGDAALAGGPTPAGPGSLMSPTADTTGLAAVPGNPLGVPGTADAGAGLPPYMLPGSTQLASAGASDGIVPEAALRAHATITEPAE